MDTKKTCDNCIYYNWYWDKCSKYDCEVDSRSVCNEHEVRENNNVSISKH